MGITERSLESMQGKQWESGKERRGAPKLHKERVVRLKGDGGGWELLQSPPVLLRAQKCPPGLLNVS